MQLLKKLLYLHNIIIYNLFLHLLLTLIKLNHEEKIALGVLSLCLSGLLLMNIHCVLGKQSTQNNVFLKYIDALAADPDTQWGCAGNPTFVPNESLKSDICISGGTHLKCKSNTGVCCDPSKQTDCPPITITK